MVTRVKAAMGCRYRKLNSSQQKEEKFLLPSPPVLLPSPLAYFVFSSPRRLALSYVHMSGCGMNARCPGRPTPPSQRSSRPFLSFSFSSPQSQSHATPRMCRCVLERTETEGVEDTGRKLRSPSAHLTLSPYRSLDGR